MELSDETKRVVQKVLVVIDQTCESEDYDSLLMKLDLHEWSTYDRVWKEALEELLTETGGVVVANDVTERVRKRVRLTRFEREPVI